MSASAVRKEFAPSPGEVASVKSWLTSAGLSVTKISANHPAGAYIGVSGSVAAASKAFGVTFGTYRGPGGQSDRAPDHAASAPSSVASSVLAVSGLDTAKSQIKPALPPPGPNAWTAKPCSTYYGELAATNKPKASTWPASSATPGASRNSTRPPIRLTTRSSSSARLRASVSCSPPETTAMGARARTPAPATTRSTHRRQVRTSHRSAEPAWPSARPRTTSGRRPGAPCSTRWCT